MNFFKVKSNSIFYSVSDTTTDLTPSDSSSTSSTLHLVVYSVNQKGRSEPIVLEDIAINEAEKRTGNVLLNNFTSFIFISSYFYI